MIYFSLQCYGYLLRNQNDDYVILRQLSNNHQLLILEPLPELTWVKPKLKRKQVYTIKSYGLEVPMYSNQIVN